MDTCISDDGTPIYLEEISSPNFDLAHNQKDSQMGDNEHIPKNSILEFSRKGGGNSRLKISGQAYQKMLQGSKVSFYNKRDLSTMTIRILNIKVTKEGGITRDHYKRKKRRRRSKKQKMKTVMVNDDTVSCSGDIDGVDGIILRESSIGGTSSSSFSFCDNLSLSGTQILQGDPTVVAPNFCLPVSWTNDTTNTSVCFQAHNDSTDHHQPFLFSARPKKYKSPSFGKMSRASPTRRLCRYPSRRFCRYPPNRQVSETKRINNSKKNQSQGEESPRHNVSTCSTSRSFSRKSLRPRGVSVSCCRYSSEAQLIKKRKETFTHLADSDRPFKKQFLVDNPTLSLFSFANNVLIKSDSESRLSTV